VTQWQKALWNSTPLPYRQARRAEIVDGAGHPLIAKQEFRLKLPAPADGNEIKLYLVASDAGDGNDNDFVVWQQPRLVAAGRPDLLLRDVREVSANWRSDANAFCQHSQMPGSGSPGQLKPGKN